ncbi:hypothetical protein OH805_01470 [Streptomyces sp. NBC_00879]|uniref:hypothetical protein n=1 Tax=Streptomyces sp. NBC_00879 TaxID=2975855 RepID=UPI003865FC3D|nr:hypothetical protein OH805_01470 [Streptomyces sp. NBC_00879]
MAKAKRIRASGRGGRRRHAGIAGRPSGMAGSTNNPRPSARGRLRRFGWWCGAVVMLCGAVMTGTLATAALGWTGTPGVMTARECHEEKETKGGTHLSCSGAFVSDDERIVDPDAGLIWDGGSPGDRKRVRTLALGGYQEQGPWDALMLLGLTSGVGLGAVICSFVALPAGARDRLAARLPRRTHNWYVREWT